MSITKPPGIFFPSVTQRSAQTKRIDQLIETSRQQILNGGISPIDDLSTFRNELQQMDFSAAQDLKDVVKWSLSHLVQGQVHVTHPGYMGLFNPAPVFPSEIAEKITTIFNPQLCVWSHAPVAVEIESHVIKQINLRIGFPSKATGHFTSGGSEANATAFLCALVKAEPKFVDEGVMAFRGKPRVYVSKESHLAWIKIAKQTGLGRNAIRLVATDGKGRMDCEDLKSTISNDLKNKDIPVLVAATAGTTNAGMVDPLENCAEVAKLHNMWFHVDAAWGGALVASNKHKHLLSGLELADSVTIDAHKWFASSMGAGMFLTRHAKVLTDAFKVSTDYMPSDDVEHDLYLNSMLWSRRFIGFRLFMSLATVGWDGFANHIEHSIDLIEYLRDEVNKLGWRSLGNTKMAVICLQPPVGSHTPEAIVKQVIQAGKHWISVTRVEDTPVIRICVTNGLTTSKDIDALIKILTASAKKP